VNDEARVTACMRTFRLASRDTFNAYFKRDDPYATDGWQWEERFKLLEERLFEVLVSAPLGISTASYGYPQPRLVARVDGKRDVPALLNREISSGYWDHPLASLSPTARLIFVSFFDWDALGDRDNRYVLVEIEDWPEHPEVNGKRALIEWYLTRFSTA
jgi:hypothetical protein